MKKTRSFGLDARNLINCQVCDNGIVRGIFFTGECDSCNGLGSVDAETGDALPDREVIKHLQARLIELEQRNKRLRQWLSEAEAKIPEHRRYYPQGSTHE